MSRPPPRPDDGHLGGTLSSAPVDPHAPTVTPLESAETVDVSSGGVPAASYPARIGRFEVRRKLGEGGMGVVLEGFDVELDRPVAIKLLRTTSESPVASARLLREAQALAKVADPNVVPIYEVGLCGSDVFIAMELVPGGTLADWLDAAPRTSLEILARFVGAGRGLAAVHAAGIVHRDFKPDNVLLGVDGRPRIADFGLARAADASAAEPSSGGAASGVGLALTREGTMMGTPMYMSPEHFEGRDIGEASDQFSFAVALYRALFHRAPFEGDSVRELSENVLGGKLVPPDVSDVPPSVVAATLRALARNPRERWPTLKELVDAVGAPLAEDPNQDPSVARRKRIAGLGLLVALNLGALIFVRLSGITYGARHVLLHGICVLVLSAGAAFAFRKELRTTHNRRLVVLFIAVSGSMVVRRTLALVSTGSTGSVIDGLRDESVGVATLLAVGAYMTEPWIAPAAVPILCFAVASTLFPDLSVLWYGLALNLAIVITIVLWARLEQTSGRDARLATQPSRSLHSGRSSGRT